MSPLWIALALLPLLGRAERFNCRGRILGAYYADAKSGCKAFHVCVRVAGGGVRDFRFFCPPGTLFHQEAQTCTDWGDDDPLACPADIYDGQFDLYKIGSGFDTKKLSSSGNRDEETEFGLQRAETGDRRLNNGPSNSGASDLRAAHSSDFFSGARDRGRDEPQQVASTNSPTPAKSSYQRQSFRRATSPRTPPPTTTVQYTTTQSPPAPPPPKALHYDGNSKRKLVRKRPIYVSTTVPSPLPSSTFSQSSPRPQFFEQPQVTFDRRGQPQTKQPFVPVPPAETTANVPPQFKDEYVEVPRVTPKHNRYFQSASPAPFSQSSPLPKNNKKEGLVELYNYDAQSTPGFNVKKNENRPFKVKNSFNVSPELPKEQDFVRTNVNINHHGASRRPTTVEFSTPTQKFASSTAAYRNFNSVSYEPERNNFVQYNTKQNFQPSPTTTQSTTIYTTPRTDPLLHLNTVAYNTNIGFNAQSSNFAESDEDDGQYRPPAGEDDGQYRPEIYERELLSGAHSLNIAASGNRLPDDQKPRAKTQPPPKVVSQTAAPRPFRPAPTQTQPPTTRAPEVYTTTRAPQTVNTQRTFDYFQTYTTTVRPSEAPLPPVVQQNYAPVSNAPQRPVTTSAPRSPEARPTSRAAAPSTVPPAPRPTTKAPHFANPANNHEDNSYDYAYYDSDPGFSEYDHIEEFGKTKSKA